MDLSVMNPWACRCVDQRSLTISAPANPDTRLRKCRPYVPFTSQLNLACVQWALRACRMRFEDGIRWPETPIRRRVDRAGNIWVLRGLRTADEGDA